MSNQAKVGMMVVLALILLGSIVTWKSSFLLKLSGYEMIGSFQNVEGLTVGSEIRYRGFKVGKVIRIDPAPEDIRVFCVIDKGIKFPTDSYLRVAFDGLVGLKFLEVRPGKSAVLYRPHQILYGKSTASIVDFVDMGTQNLVETKKILVAIKDIVEKPEIQHAFINAVLNIEKATIEINRLTKQLQAVAAAVNNIVGDKNFQENFKGTVATTNKTLSSANQFFEGFSSLKAVPSGDILFGTTANQVKGNLDIKAGENNSLMMSMGEGPTRNIALLDLQISNIVAKNLGLRIGMINTHLGGGVDYYMTNKLTLSGDIYDLNNPRPSNPKLRLTGKYSIEDYVDLMLQADDFFNGNNANYSIGFRVKGK